MPAALNLFAQPGCKLIENPLLLRGQVGGFERIGLQVVELQRCERAILEEFPIAAPVSFDGLSAVGDTALAADEVQVAFGFRQNQKPPCLSIVEQGSVKSRRSFIGSVRLRVFAPCQFKA